MRLFQAKKRVRPRDFSRTYALAVETGIGENHVRRTAAPIFDGAGKGKDALSRPLTCGRAAGLPASPPEGGP